jgi:hypothetical protein
MIIHLPSDFNVLLEKLYTNLNHRSKELSTIKKEAKVENFTKK